MESSFRTEARPLPDLLDTAEIATVRVIKIDVEGAEGSVVRGLAPMLGALRPDAEIAVEVAPERMARLGDRVDDLLAVMRDAGFHGYRLPNDYAPGSYPPALSGAPRAGAAARAGDRGERPGLLAGGRGTAALTAGCSGRRVLPPLDAHASVFPLPGAPAVRCSCPRALLPSGAPAVQWSKSPVPSGSRHPKDASARALASTTVIRASRSAGSTWDAWPVSWPSHLR